MKPRSTKLQDPEKHFSNWAYKIERWHYPALGVTWREYVVRKLGADGSPPKQEHPLEAAARAKKHSQYACWAESNPLQLGFTQGDVFHNRANDNLVIQVRSIPIGGSMEVTSCIQGDPATVTHRILNQDELVAWLKSGRAP